MCLPSVSLDLRPEGDGLLRILMPLFLIFVGSCLKKLRACPLEHCLFGDTLIATNIYSSDFQTVSWIYRATSCLS